MKSQSNQLLLILFTALSLLNLWGDQVGNISLVYFTKPLLLTTLSLYFFLNKNGLPASFWKWMLAGLLFSIGGDTFLMFVENGPDREYLFFFGLGCFLLTHLCYLRAFLQYPSAQKGWLRQRPWMLLPYLLFLAGMLSYLWPSLGGDFKIPVAVYSMAIVLMAAGANNLSGKIPREAFQFLFAGVLLFLFSDTIIALNKFKSFQLSIPYSRLIIMISYLAGQYLIVKGSLLIGELRES